jgi:hypothetical protein
MKMLLQQTNGDLLDPTVANYDILCYWQAFPTFQSYQI